MPHSSLTLSALLSRRDWENPQLTQWHRLPAHAPFNSWREASAARLDSASASRLSLNGNWRFNFFSAPEAVPEGWVEQDLHDAVAMPVPSNWQMHGFDTPI